MKYNLQNSVVPTPCPQSDAAADAAGALLIPLPQPMLQVARRQDHPR